MTRPVPPCVVAKGLNETSVRLSAFGARRKCRDRRWSIDRALMTQTDRMHRTLRSPTPLQSFQISDQLKNCVSLLRGDDLVSPISTNRCGIFAFDECWHGAGRAHARNCRL